MSETYEEENAPVMDPVEPPDTTPPTEEPNEEEVEEGEKYDGGDIPEVPSE